MACILATAPLLVRAGTTGMVTGTVIVPSPSQSASTTTDARGFYSILSLVPDRYTLSFVLSGCANVSVPGIVVQQDLNDSMQRLFEFYAGVKL